MNETAFRETATGVLGSTAAEIVARTGAASAGSAEVALFVAASVACARAAEESVSGAGEDDCRREESRLNHSDFDGFNSGARDSSLWTVGSAWTSLGTLATGKAERALLTGDSAAGLKVARASDGPRTAMTSARFDNVSKGEGDGENVISVATDLASAPLCDFGLRSGGASTVP